MPHLSHVEPHMPWGPSGELPLFPGPITDQAQPLANVYHQASGYPDCWEPCHSSGRLRLLRNWIQDLSFSLPWKGDKAETGVPTLPQPSHPPPPLLPSSLTSQCGFFHRSSQSSSFPTNYHRARLAVQPSAVEAGGPGTVG